MRYAFLIAYDGTEYFGFVRQPNVRTVERVLLEVFKEVGLFQNLREARYRVAARTDRGVSALAQTIALEVQLGPDIKTLNSELPEDIVVLSTSSVQSIFDPRKDVIAKHYRYVCPVPENFDFEVVKKTVRLVEGPHDFRCFCKREPGSNTKNSILYAAVKMEKHLIFDFIAKLFLRQQVRRMVQGLLELGQGLIGTDWFSQALNGETSRSFRPAPPEGLFLAGIRYRRLLFKPKQESVSKLERRLKSKRDLRSREMLDFLKTKI